jgi:hypothetical protein
MKRICWTQLCVRWLRNKSQFNDFAFRSVWGNEVGVGSTVVQKWMFDMVGRWPSTRFCFEEEVDLRNRKSQQKIVARERKAVKGNNSPAAGRISIAQQWKGESRGKVHLIDDRKMRCWQVLNEEGQIVGAMPSKIVESWHQCDTVGRVETYMIKTQHAT